MVSEYQFFSCRSMIEMAFVMQKFWTLGLTMVILGLCLWLYQKYTKAYQKFPTFSGFLHFVDGYLFRPKHIPLTAYMFQKFVEFSKRYETEGVFLTWAFEPVLFIFSEEAIKVFSNVKTAIDKPYKYRIMKDFFGEGTITSNGDRWKKRRRMFNPVFYKDMLKSKVSTCNEHAGCMIKDLANVKNKSIHILDYIKICSFGIICESILGINIQEERNKELGQIYVDAITKLSECGTSRFINPWMHYQIILNITPHGREYLKCYKTCSRIHSELLLKMKESASSESSKDDFVNQVGKSFAHVLMEHHLKDSRFTMKEMEDEICTYISAGFDTVSYSMMWSLFLLGHHPEIQNRVFEEVHSTIEEFITYDDTCRFKYLECVIKESLRLYSPVPLFARHLKEDVQCGNYKVPKDTTIVFFPYRLHRNSEIFPDPENFNPDRFLGGNLEKHPWAFVPFSEGIRSCIGKKFAMMEMKIVLASIIRNYQVISLDERDSVELNWQVILAPTKPLYMQLVPRQ